ncbi:putative dehydrogenase [Motilibacter peucedani]|uniref:Putative dehydrogenase n=1 Tax=Motilibacter peucedani TaxID=598650 RepID=A0A420XTH6_9ACTN|nr:Gfo/Idh/MocA family oxidoreductase [Motilibacter peucedani]RKS80041.1 putative dehydrogenase [Motilibacter peucedani]
MTRVGFLGCAHVHATTYCDELGRASSGAEAVAVYDHDPQRRDAFARDNGLAAMPTPESLCEVVDAVIVTSEHVHYADLVAAAAAAGLPILCEKPLGDTPVASDLLRCSGSWLSMALPVRYAPAVQSTRALAQSGALGRLLAASGVNHAPNPGGFFTDPALAGGGSLLDHVVHLADALRWISGAEYSSVFAETSQASDLAVEDIAQVVAFTTDDAWLTIDASWSRPRGMLGGVDFLMRLWFERGRVEIDAFARRAEIVRPGGAVEHLPYGRGINSSLLQHWLRAIRDGAPPPIPVEDGWRATEVAFAALQSAASASLVTLPTKER